jgi:hypothetical protein
MKDLSVSTSFPSLALFPQGWDIDYKIWWVLLLSAMKFSAPLLDRHKPIIKQKSKMSNLRLAALH